MVPFHPMAMNIKDTEVEALAGEVAALTGETKTRAVKIALQERRDRLAAAAAAPAHADRLRRFLETEAWPQIPDQVRGRALTRQEREEILGYGPDGV